MKYLISTLMLLTLVIWFAVISFPDSNLHIVACDVGQGDAILIYYKDFQILIDGGPDNKVVECLSKYMPFWDRHIEVVSLSHQQVDHFTGLIEVFKRYSVENFLASSLESSTQSYQVLKSQVGGQGARIINPKIGMSIRYSLIYLDSVFPDDPNTNVLGNLTSKDDPNTFSLITKVRFGGFSCLFTGDIELYSNLPSSDCLKVPHHGSKNGLTKEMLDVVNPKVALISVGKNNKYGHPNKEVIDMLKEKGVKILRTDESGDVEVISNGTKWWVSR